MIRALIVPYLLLAGFLASVGYAQESDSPKSATALGNSASTPANGASFPAERVIIKVGNRQVTKAEFETRISDIEPQGDPDKASLGDKDRRKLGDDYASVLMLSQQAVAEHLDSSPEVSRQLAIARLQILSDAEFARLMRQAQPTPEEISQYYSAHPADYEQVRIRRLFIWKRGADSKNTRGISPQEARSRADAILQASATGGDATKLADSLKDSQEGMFDAVPIAFPLGELPPKMEKAAFGLKEGEWSEVEDTPDSLILIQLIKHNRRPLNEVSSLIEKLLQAEKMQAKLNDLKRNSSIWMDEKYFGTDLQQRPVSNSPPEVRKSTGKEERTNEDARQK